MNARSHLVIEQLARFRGMGSEDAVDSGKGTGIAAEKAILTELARTQHVHHAREASGVDIEAGGETVLVEIDNQRRIADPSGFQGRAPLDIGVVAVELEAGP